MNSEDLFSCFKSEFVRDEFDAHTQILAEYLAAHEEGIRVNDLAALNESLSLLVENSEEVPLTSFGPATGFFEAAALGFVKNKNFDDKLNNDSIVRLFNIIARVVDKLNAVFEREELELYADRAQAVLLLAFKSIAFVLSFLTGKVGFHSNGQSQMDLKKLTRVEYFTIKRSKNLRECEAGVRDSRLPDDVSLASTQDSFHRTPEAEGTPKPQFVLYEQSNLPIAFIDFLQKHSSVLSELAILVLEIKLATSQFLSLSRRLVSLGFLKDIIYIIYDNKTRFRDYFIRLAFEILWNYVELLEKEAIVSVESEDILLIFKDLFCLVLANGFKLEDKILRNELIVMINNLMESGKLVPFVHEPAAPGRQVAPLDITDPDFRRLSLLQILLHIAVYDETTGAHDTKSVIGKRKKLFDLSNEDLQFKKLLINALHLIVRSCESPEALGLIQNSSFVETLLMYVNAEQQTNRCVKQFSKPQIKDLQGECLAALEELAVRFTTKLLNLDIMGILMKLISRLKGDPRVIAGLRILLRLFEVSHKDVQHRFGETNLFDIVLEYLNSTESLQGISDDDIIRARTLGFMIIGYSCADYPTNQRLFAQKGGVETLLLFLKNQKVHRSEKNLLLMVAVFSALWNCVLGNPKNEDIFLENDGFFILMEFLESALRVNLKMALSAVSGLMENRKCFHYFEEWISSTSSASSTQLLIKLYQEEDRRFGVEYKDGVLVNALTPLNPGVTQTQRELGVRKGYSKKAFGKLINALKTSTEEQENQKCSRHIFVSVEAILVKHLKENCELVDLRRSIFAILYRIGFDRHKVSREDCQILTVIQNYPQLRVGEIWNEIQTNFARKKIALIAEDANFINRNIAEFRRLTDFCVKQQEFIATEKRLQQEEELTKFYDLIRHQKKYIR